MKPMSVSRRAFLAGAGAVVTAPAISLGQAQRVFKFAVVGCGGRGSGAVREITQAAARLGHKAVLVGAVPPLMLKTPANPGGLPIDVFDCTP